MWATENGGAQIVRFDVCDRGPGIPAALRATLGATPIDSTQGGHGVGLYLAFAAAGRRDRTRRLRAAQHARGAAAAESRDERGDSAHGKG